MTGELLHYSVKQPKYNIYENDMQRLIVSEMWMAILLMEHCSVVIVMKDRPPGIFWIHNAWVFKVLESEYFIESSDHRLHKSCVHTAK